jgi:hypothetical protein
MTRPLRQKRTSTRQDVIPHGETDNPQDLLALKDFLEENHPSNDQYMRSLGLIQRQIMTLTHQLRTKQVNILKTVFSGANYTEAAARHHTTPQTVSKLVKSEVGASLLGALQYHQAMIEGANVAQRRNMLWRIATANEKTEPKVSISAVGELNKMTFSDYTAPVERKDKGAPANTQKTVAIDQTLLPSGALDA